jgi:hypothetical protein
MRANVAAGRIKTEALPFEIAETTRQQDPRSSACTNDNATCAITSDRLGTNDFPWPPRPMPASASSGGVRDIAQAGAPVNSMPVMIASSAENSSTDADGAVATGTYAAPGNASAISRARTQSGDDDSRERRRRAPATHPL